MTATEAESSSVAETESESVTKMEDTMAMQSNAEAVEEQKKRERAETEEEPEEPEPKAESQSFWMRCVAFWKAKLTPSLDWWLHFGNGLAICSMLMQEMLPLRCFLVAANACAFVFYQKQTPPLKVPSMWSIFFLCGHSVMIIRLLLENRKVDLTDIEHEVYINAFQQYGFSPIQFKKIVRYADIRRLDAGDVICYEGKPKLNTMYVLGVAELTQNETVVGGIINGFVGDLLSPESNKKAQEELKKFREKKLVDREQKLMDSMVQHQIIPEPVSAEKAAESEEATKSEEAEQKQEPEQEADEASTTDKAAVGTDEGELENESESESEENKAITINDDDVVPEIKTKEEEKKKAEHVFLETLKEGIKERMEFHDPDIWNHTVVALEQSTLLVWDREELHKLMSADPRLKQAAILAFAGDLSYKLKTDKKFNMLRTYKEMLEMAMCDYTIDAGEKARLDKFREENGISSTEHEACVKGLGWSMEEFDSGVKHTESYGEKLRNWYYLNWTAKHQTGQ